MELQPGIWVQIGDSVIDPARVLALICDPSHGAILSFFGVVRNHNLGKAVRAVSYDVFQPLAENVIRAICQTAREKWGEGLRILVQHRKGTLQIGEVSVAILVSSPHRDESYQASRFIIEEIKHRCPIWKKEHYETGDSDWVKGHALCGQAPNPVLLDV